jgi:hypothetical protein
MEFNKLLDAFAANPCRETAAPVVEYDRAHGLQLCMLDKRRQDLLLAAHWWIG